MRHAARLVLVAAAAAALLPSTSASAMVCQPKPLNVVCGTVCRVGYELGFQCVD